MNKFIFSLSLIAFCQAASAADLSCKITNHNIDCKTGSPIVFSNSIDTSTQSYQDISRDSCAPNLSAEVYSTIEGDLKINVIQISMAETERKFDVIKAITVPSALRKEQLTLKIDMLVPHPTNPHVSVEVLCSRKP